MYKIIGKTNKIIYTIDFNGFTESGTKESLIYTLNRILSDGKSCYNLSENRLRDFTWNTESIIKFLRSQDEDLAKINRAKNMILELKLLEE